MHVHVSASSCSVFWFFFWVRQPREVTGESRQMWRRVKSVCHLISNKIKLIRTSSVMSYDTDHVIFSYSPYSSFFSSLGGKVERQKNIGAAVG